MRNFKKHLALFASALTFVTLATTTAVCALDTGDMAAKTNNIDLNNLNGVKFNIDMKANAGKGAVAQIDWTKYNVGKDQTIKYGFSNSAQTIINRVVGNGNISFINGKITSGCATGVSCGNAAASGKVMLINPAGVVFNQNSSVDLNSFTVSTKDIKGIKNLKDVTNLTDYQNTLNNMSKNITFVNGSGATTVWLDGTSIAAGKSIGVVADKIVYKNSLLKTKEGNSNVKLITADGVTFAYADDGRISSATSKTATSKQYINMDNSGLKGAAIESPSVLISTHSKGAESYTQVANTIIKGTKLVKDDKGHISIAGNKTLIGNSQLNAEGDIKITGSNVSQIAKNSKLSAKGALDISADKTILVKDSSLNAKSANVTSGDKVTFDNAKVDLTSNADIKSNGQLYIKDSTVNAKSDIKAQSSNGNVFVSNSKLDSKDANLQIGAEFGLAQVYNNSSLNASKVNSIEAKNITVQDSSMASGNVYANATDKLAFVNAKTNASTVYLGSINQTYIKDSTLASTGQIGVRAVDGNVLVEKSNITASQNGVSLTSDKGTAMVYSNSNLSGQGVKVSAKDVIFKDSTATSKLSVELSGSNNTTVANAKLDTSAATGGSYLYLNGVKFPNGQVIVKADKQLYVKDSNINSKNEVSLASANGKAYVQNSTLKSKDASVSVKAAKSNAYVYDNSKLTAGTNVSVNSKTSNLTNATVNAKNLNVESTGSTTLSNVKATLTNKANIKAANQLLVEKSNIQAKNGIVAESTKTNTYIKGSTLKTEDANLAIRAKNGTVSSYDNTKLTSKATVGFTGKNVYLKDNTVNAKKLSIGATNKEYIYDSKITTSSLTTLRATNGIYAKDTKVNNKKITINGKKSVQY